MVLQIKEKLGSLRFYYRLQNATSAQEVDIEKLIEKAYEASLLMCSECGELGSLQRRDGPAKVLCVRHV